MYSILFVILWILLSIYTDWKMYIANENFYKNNPDHIKTPVSFGEKYLFYIFFFTLPFLLISNILVYGFIILNNNRNIFNGEKFN